MNIDTFGITSENNSIPSPSSAVQDDSFVHDEVAHIKQKIENRKSKRKKLKLVLGSLLSLIVILILIVLYSQYKLYVLGKEELIVDPGQRGQYQKNINSTPKTGEEIIQALRRHVLVPEGDPQIAEVQDVSKLKEKQAFFKDAQNGDVVIVYSTMIYIYRPTADVVVASSDISGLGQEKP